MNNYESLLSNKKTFFDNPVAHTKSTHLTSPVRTVVAFVANGSLNDGMVVTSMNLLPYGRLKGGCIAQAIFKRSIDILLSFAIYLILGISGVSGRSSVDIVFTLFRDAICLNP